MKFLKRNPGYSGKVSLYGHSLGSVLSYDILCHQKTLWAPFPTEYLNMEWTSDRSQGAKSANEVAVHDSATKDHDIATLRHSCADSVNGVVDEDNTRTDASHMDGAPPSCVIENSPNNDDTVVSPGAVDTEQNEEENTIENHQTIHAEEGTTSAVSSKDAEGSSMSRSAEEVNEEVLDKDKLIFSLEEEVKRLKARLEQLEQQNHLVAESISGVEYHEGKSANLAINSGKLFTVQGGTNQSYSPQIRYTKLNFKVDTFFAVGSPLGVFLSLRNVRIGIGMEPLTFFLKEKISAYIGKPIWNL